MTRRVLSSRRWEVRLAGNDSSGSNFKIIGAKVALSIVFAGKKLLAQRCFRKFSASPVTRRGAGHKVASDT